MPNAKSQIPNPKCQLPNAKCQMPNAQMPNAKCQMHKSQMHKSQMHKCRIQNAKFTNAGGGQHYAARVGFKVGIPVSAIPANAIGWQELANRLRSEVVVDDNRPPFVVLASLSEDAVCVGVNVLFVV